MYTKDLEYSMCISTHVIKPRFYIKSPHPNAHEGVIKFQISITYIRSMLHIPKGLQYWISLPFLVYNINSMLAPGRISAHLLC